MANATPQTIEKTDSSGTTLSAGMNGACDSEFVSFFIVPLDGLFGLPWFCGRRDVRVFAVADAKRNVDEAFSGLKRCGNVSFVE
jgi:hypothetical protein